MTDWCDVQPTEADLADMVRHQDPRAMRWFGALLDGSPYLPCRRTEGQSLIDHATKATWPKFEITGKSNDDTKKACLWEPVVKANGQHWSPMFQETGSCVCQGGHGATAYTMAVEAWVKGELEQVKFPLFAYIAYGRSRFYIGDRGPGEGSLGSAMARAIKEDGLLAADYPGLPSHEMSNGGISWGRRNELRWSFIPDRADEFDPFQDAAKKHPIQTVAQARRADDVAAGVRNGYGGTCASMWGGQMKCQVVSDPPVLLNKRTGQWAHQMCVIGWWEHPKLGELFYILNSWGNPHGDDPSGGPPGGFWISKADMDWICRDEVFLFSNFKGFPAQMLPWGSIQPTTRLSECAT